MIAARVATQQSITVLVIDATANKTYIKTSSWKASKKLVFN
jgi:hypothetical protein